MRKTLIAALLVLGVSATSASLALSSDETQAPDLHAKLQNARMVQELTSRARNLGTSTSDPTDLDTTWVGYTPGAPSANNPWLIYAGHGKEGYRRVINGQGNLGVWDFEEPVNGDSLQGWWPAHYRMVFTGGIQNDRNRPFAAVDYGNVANYRSVSKPTYGVLGVWHVDGGNLQAGPTAGLTPKWRPPAGTKAAWMGLRAHGDVSSTDPITGNAFNEDVLVKGGSGILPASADGNDKGFPGYGSQMDQMLYRDIDYQTHANEDLTVTFNYRTVMSTSSLSTTTTRTGWFDGDPLAFTGGNINPTPNNFISAADAGVTNAPVDSFMVYIGTGVDGNQWLGSDGDLHDVYDPQRRWFAEVLHWDRDPNSNPDNPTPLYYKELLSVAGNNPANAPTNPLSFVVDAFQIPYASLQPYLAKNGKIRLVFRVKTNRGSSDETTDYTSRGAGAAVVDNVQIAFGANPLQTLGAFESASEINNDVNVAATDAWKSTGKPPSIIFHTHEFADLPYDDICGDKGSPGRVCNMTGVVVSMGNHDNAEFSNGALGTAEQDRVEGILSPAIQFAGPFDGPGGKNAQGLYAQGANGGVGDVDATEDYYLFYDIYAGLFDASNDGQFWNFGAQAYPAKATKALAGAPNNYDGWGSLLIYGFVIFNTDIQCLIDIEPLVAGGVLATSNASGIPDSLRVYIGTVTYCFGFGLSTTCGGFGGKYFDNVSLALIDGAPVAINVDPWMWYNDTFPANEDDNLVTSKALFDTTSALIRIGLNTATVVQDILSNNVPGDSVWINSAQATKRMDMVFRVLPGPGNYEPIGDGHNGTIRKVPTNPATVVANDGTWWDVYRRIPGDFASPNAATLMASAKGGWDPNCWVSARCDTAEINLYAFQGRAILGGPAVEHDWMSTYHESDPKYNLLGIDHFICFVRCSTCALSDRICDGTVPLTGNPGGYEPVGTPGTTKEGTGIIPDGLLTPGSHVEYFFRSQEQEAPTTLNVAMDPDTNNVFPSDGGASTDGHRWQEFSVLPDRWKDPQYLHPVYQTLGRGPACLLVYDGNDRRGNERVWVSVADTIGATAPQKFGAHNGWHAAGGQDVNDPAARVYVHGGSPGTSWDLFQQKASESLNNPAGSIGSRLSYRGGPAIVADKSSRLGPTPAMLNQFYTLFLYLSGDINSGVLGPFDDKSANDAGILQNWMQQGDINFQTRGFWAMGDGFVEDAWENYAASSPQGVLLSNYLGVGLVNSNYKSFASNPDQLADLQLQPEWQGKGTGQVQVFGMRNLCLWTNDVLAPDGIGLNLGSIADYYDRTTGGAQGPASVFKDWDPTSPWKALTDGWDIEHLTTRLDVNTVNRSTYFFKIFSNVWSKICFNVVGTPVVPLDVPSFEDGNLVNFVNLKGNPVKPGSQATIAFGLKSRDQVQIDIFDVAGRLVRSLAKRQFEAGPHEIVWDGLDNAGRQVARGVYFTQVKYQNSQFSAAKKLTVLK